MSLSSSGTVVAIGAILNDGVGDFSGHARIFMWNGTSWTQLGSDIDAESANDQNGSSVSINSDGTIVAIGARANDGGGNFSGSTRVYNWNGVSWTQLGSDIDGQAGDSSGDSVSIDGDGTSVAIGSYGNDNGGINAGCARVYTWNGTSWIQKGNNINGAVAGEYSGRFVSLSKDGNVLAIGAILNDGNTGDINDNRGAVRVYVWNGTGWIQRGTSISGELSGDQSGQSVSLNYNGSVLAISGGAARVYYWDGVSWIKRGDNLDLRSSSISLNNYGDVVAIGWGGFNGQAKAYQWNSFGLNWIQIFEKYGEDFGDFGTSISLNAAGNVLAIGDIESGVNQGKVKIYKLYFPAAFPIGNNTANYNNCSDWNGQNGNVTTVGSNGGPSFYGTFDQSGNVNEWNDLDGTAGNSRGLRGGHWAGSAFGLSSSGRSSNAPSGGNSSSTGFRLSSSSSILNPLNLPYFVTVGDLNNSNDTTGYGSVSYFYQIAQYQVTNCEYVQFLNAVASSIDAFSLYNINMTSNVRGGITRSGSSGSYTYTVKANMGNKPVNYVHWFHAARYCNWLHNGKPSGPQNSSSTEDGAYTLNGATTGNAVVKNHNASYSIPTENEWYKAAYYKGGSTNAGYWSYATQSDSEPSCVSANSTGDGPVSSNYSCSDFFFTFTDPTPSFSGTFTSSAYTNGPAHGRGSTAFWGGVLTPSGKVVMVPFSSTTIGIYDPDANTYANGPSHGGGGFAFIGGVLTPSGKVVMVPYNSTTIGIYDPVANTYTNGPAHGLDSVAFVGGVLTPSGKVVMVPYSSTTIGIYDPVANTYTNGPAHGRGSDAFYGGVLTPSGKVVLVPYISSTVGIYDPVANTYTDGPSHGGGGFAFIGGVLTPSGKVVLVPFASSNVGIYDPVANTYTDGPAHGRGSSAFIGGMLTPSGKVVLVPRNSTTVGIYDPVANTYTNGPAHGRGIDAFVGGVLTPSGKVVMVPYNSTNVGILTPDPLLSVSASTAMSPYLNKF